MQDKHIISAASICSSYVKSHTFVNVNENYIFDSHMVLML